MCPSNTHMISLWRGHLSHRISSFSGPVWFSSEFDEPVFIKTNQSDAILLFHELFLLFVCFFSFCSVTKSSLTLMSIGNKSYCQWGSGCVSWTDCSLLSELSKSPHRLLHWLCVCQPTCPALPPPFSSPASFSPSIHLSPHLPPSSPLPKASLISHALAPAYWSVSLMSFVSGWSE